MTLPSLEVHHPGESKCSICHEDKGLADYCGVCEARLHQWEAFLAARRYMLRQDQLDEAKCRARTWQLERATGGN